MGTVRLPHAVTLGDCAENNSYGKDDELGTLNRLTNDVVLEAVKEIKEGTRYDMARQANAPGNTILNL